MVFGLELAVVGLGALVAVAAHQSGSSFVGPILEFAAFGIVGIVVAARQPQNPMGWILLGAAGFLMLSGAASSYSVLDYRMRHGSLPLGALAVILQPTWAPAVVLLGLTVLVFPDGKLPSRRWRWILWPVLAAGAAFQLGAFAVALIAIVSHDVHVTSGGDLTLIDYPTGGWVWWAYVEGVFFSVVGASWLVWLVYQVPSYRRSAGELRLQKKWLLSGALLFVIGLVCSVGLNNAEGAWVNVANVALAIGFLALPISLAVGILKFRLYDIDRLISRTLAYAIVTGLVVGVYVGVVTLATKALGFSSPVGVAASTLAAVALFNPLRHRIQRVVDRRFNRARYDAEATVASFSALAARRGRPRDGAQRAPPCRQPGRRAGTRLGVGSPARARMMDEGQADDTRVVRAGRPAPSQGRPFLPGPTFAGTYHLSGDPSEVPFVYGRYHNPTWSAYEQAVGDLDGGSAVVFASGMAALSACLLTLLRPGHKLVLANDCYYTTRRLVSEYLSEIGVEVQSAPTASAELRELAEHADVLFLETPSNPHLDVCDIADLASVTHSRGGTVVVDNSTATALGQSPLGLGADLVVSADTKATTGHSDLILGHVSAADAELAAKLTAWRTQTGGVPGPQEVWLAHRSLATLAVRFARQCDNAIEVAQMLSGHPAVVSVRYPGLPGDPGHAVALRQMKRFGGVVSFELADAGTAQRFLASCRLVDEATSFGGVGSSAERRARWGGDAIGPGFIRFSAGLEATEDLLADLEQALTVAA